jgi:hypothetical protein
MGVGMVGRNGSRPLLLLGVAFAAAVDAASSALASPMRPAKNQVFTRVDYGTLVSNPNRYKGDPFDIVGQVLGSLSRVKSGVLFQVFADRNNSQWNTAVARRSPAPTVRTGDDVRVRGVVNGQFTGKNDSGGSVTTVVIAATSVTESHAP